MDEFRRCGSEGVTGPKGVAGDAGGVAERRGVKREEHSAIGFGCIRFQVLSIPPRGLC